MKKRRYISLGKKKLEIDSDKSYPSNSYYNGEGDIEQEPEEDN